jgi:hypothetical protein
MSSTNVRARGKIRHDEWPNIAERFQRGETLAQIARSYGCTPPAIRYIVGRTINGGVRVKTSHGAQSAASLEQAGERSASHSGRASALTQPTDARRTAGGQSAGNDIWGRINNDIAMFLAAMDALFTSESDKNYESLLRATDRLLWASARTRLELERVLGARRASGTRRRALA